MLLTLFHISKNLMFCVFGFEFCLLPPDIEISSNTQKRDTHCGLKPNGRVTIYLYLKTSLTVKTNKIVNLCMPWILKKNLNVGGMINARKN